MRRLLFIIYYYYSSSLLLFYPFSHNLPSPPHQTWGNLATTLFASSPTLSSHRPTITEAVAKLEVGSVGINIWGGTCVFFPQFRWGGYPGNTPEDIQSGSGRGKKGEGGGRGGRGVEWGVEWGLLFGEGLTHTYTTYIHIYIGVGNFLCYDGVKKSVLWAPLLHDFVTVSPSSPAQVSSFFPPFPSLLPFLTPLFSSLSPFFFPPFPQARKEGMRLSEFNTTQSYFSLIKVASALYFGI